MKIESTKKVNVYIEATALASAKMSGIGHLTLNLINGLLEDEEFQKSHQLALVVPFNKAASVRAKFNQPVTIKKLWLPSRVIELLLRVRLLPYMDLFLGNGLYLFPNYKNWPLLRSTNYTYIHDLGFVKHPKFVQPKNLIYLRTYVPLWIKRASKILTISEFSKTEIMEEYSLSTEKVALIYPGIDPKQFTKQSPVQIEKIRVKYKLGTRPYFLFVGNIEPRKNLERLVVAFNQLDQQSKEKFSLVLVGAEGWLNGSIHESIKAARLEGSNIIFPSQHVTDEDLPALYSGAFALLHPALYEGFGIPPVEAMACGIPTAISNVEPMPEVASGAALLFNPLHADEITQAIKALIENSKLRSELITKGLRRAQDFNLKTVTQKLVTLITEESKQ